MAVYESRAVLPAQAYHAIFARACIYVSLTKVMVGIHMIF